MHKQKGNIYVYVCVVYEGNDGESTLCKWFPHFEASNFPPEDVKRSICYE